jgi:hypothetical protein
MHNSHCLTDGADVHGFHYMMMHKPAKSSSLDELIGFAIPDLCLAHTHQQRGTNAIRLQIQQLYISIHY